MKPFKQLGLIGCGMMGGSFALAAKQSGLVERVVGYNKSPSKSDVAKRMGVIDDVAASVLQAVMGADLVLIAVPVSATFDVLKAARLGLSQDALILDVGSTKQSVIQAVEKVFTQLPSHFVPSHPIAGKELAGVESADATLYHGKRVILTPTHDTSEQAIQLATDVWQRIGMKVSIMSAQHHDQVLGAVSHLPHVLAFAYMLSIVGQANHAQLLEMAGPGFKDFTRIAAGDPDVWVDILLANQQEIAKQSSHMLASLSQVEQMMREADAAALRQLITTASRARGSWMLNQKVAVDDV